LFQLGLGAQHFILLNAVIAQLGQFKLISE